MVGISFDNIHSYYDLGLVLTSKDIQTSSAKVTTVEVAGGDGVLDLTDFFGDTKFKNRKLVFKFKKTHDTTADFLEDWSNIQNNLSGKKVKITLDEDVSSYYIGRITMSYKRTRNITEVTFTCDCEPYKMKWDNTVKTKLGSGTLDLPNLRKKVVPTITTTANTTIVFGQFTWTLSVGEWVLPELELVAGNNTVTITSTGTTSFSYQEGGL